jgi:RNA ligase
VNYGDRAELVLLSVRETATDAELPLPEWGGANVPRYDAETVDELLASANGGDREGYVIRFPRTGERVKVKLEEYVRLHRVLTGCSARSIWECLSMGQNLDPLLDRVPDEFFAWVRDRERELSRRFEEIRDSCAEIMRDPRVVRDDRKTTAEFFKTQPYPAVLFRMLDGKDYVPLIWKLIRPEHAVPFRRDEV